MQSDASLAWAEGYLTPPYWLHGFDPTNGCSVAQDRIHVAYGRNYIDSTSTSGTFYNGGGPETFAEEVRMEEVEE